MSHVKGLSKGEDFSLLVPKISIFSRLKVYQYFFFCYDLKGTFYRLLSTAME